MNAATGYDVAVPWLHDDGADVRSVTLRGTVEPDGCVFDARLEDDATGALLPLPAGYEDQAQIDLREAAEALWGVPA